MEEMALRKMNKQEFIIARLGAVRLIYLPDSMAYRAITDAIDLLKEQPEIVRCKDCKYSHEVANSELLQCVSYGRHKPDWFCAKGVRKYE